LTTNAGAPLNDAGSSDALQDECLGALTALGGSAGNVRLPETLEWNEASYNDAVKAELLGRSLIMTGRGRGGSVALADAVGEVSGMRQNSGATRASRGQNATRAANGARTAAPSSLEQAFRAIDDCLRKEAGCGSELDYTEQTSWLLFLKYLDGLEDHRAAMAALEGRSYSPILEEAYRWNSSMACVSTPRPRSTSSRCCTRRRSSGWATPLATAVSITRRGR